MKNRENGMKNREKFAEMRAAGKKPREIAEACGCSQQYVSYVLRRNDATFRMSEKRCVYPGLREWMSENHVPATELSRKLYGERKETIYSRLNGKSEWKLGEIRTLLRSTGKEFTELFGER